MIETALLPVSRRQLGEEDISVLKISNKLQIRNSTSGFTLIELLVTTVIIALLASAAIVSFRPANKQGRDNRRNIDLQSIRSALEVYRSDCGAYPTQMPWGAQLVGGPTTAPCYNNVYMEKVPQDPRHATNIYYYRYVNTNQYYLCSNYEVLPSVAPQATINTNCGSATACTVACKNFVTNP